MENTKDKIRMTVTRESDNSCEVIEHTLDPKKDRVVAKFYADRRHFKTEDGDDAVRDMAQIRAVLFAKTFEKLVNEEKVAF